MTSTMNMASMTSTASMSASSTAMSMSMGGSNTCKISMLWNWYTIDACFLTTTWQIKSHGAFAATCIGVILLVVILELFRRLSKEYDQHISRNFQASITHQTNNNNELRTKLINDNINTNNHTITYRITPLQQLLRSLLHAITFGIAYIIMLLAMYYNGYIIICIFIGAGLGKFVCDWMVLKVSIGGGSGGGGSSSSSNGGDDRVNMDMERSKIDSICEDPTVCCG